MQIKYRNYNNVLYVMLDGELDEHTAKFTSKKLDEVFMSTISKQIIIDLSELKFMDSTGIGVLIGRYKRIKSENKQIYIANPNNQIEKIFRMSGIYEIMPKIS